MLTLTEATEQTGKSKSTLIRAIKSGKLSAQRNEHGDYRVEPSELFRVYESVTHRDESEGAPVQQAYVDLIAPELLEMVRERDQELSDLRDELKDTSQRLDEHREASRALMSPEQFDEKLKTAIHAEREKAEAKSREWEQALAERQAEIAKARHDASELAEQLKAQKLERVKAEQVAKQLQGRGLIARLFNRKPDVVL